MNSRNTKLIGLVALASGLLLGAGEPLSTERHVHGVITAVDPTVVQIASSQRTVSGKIDPARTKVTIHGKPAKLADLKVTAHAKAELCLDDVWISIDAH
ncbi:MAG: hypothetical protein JWP87_2980 [Labilithrix sp.]|jgi:hypothetical protein|nr:hypothetical protein [Labilithrix sp.]